MRHLVGSIDFSLLILLSPLLRITPALHLPDNICAACFGGLTYII
jgi:hypothetical protein